LDQFRQLIGLAKLAGLAKILNQLANVLDQLTGVVGLAEPSDQLVKLAELIKLIDLAKLVNQLPGLLEQLAEITRLVKLLEMAEILDQMEKLVGLVRLAGRAELLDYQAQLLSQPTILASSTRRVGLVVLNGLEPHALLLAQRLTGHVLAHRNSGHGCQCRHGYRYGSHSPHVRPEVMRCVVKCPDFHGMPSLLAAGDIRLPIYADGAGRFCVVAGVSLSACTGGTSRGSGRVAPLRGSHGMPSP
jgi:hypothetical protein